MSEACDLLCLDLAKAEGLRRERPADDELSRVAALARSLGDPTRLSLAIALSRGGELCVCDLAWVSERSEKLVSHHVRALRTAGIARSRREGKMVLYELTGAGRALVDTVVGAAREGAAP